MFFTVQLFTFYPPIVVMVIVIIMVSVLCLGVLVKTAYMETVVINIIVLILSVMLILTQSRFNIVHTVVKTASVITTISLVGANV